MKKNFSLILMLLCFSIQTFAADSLKNDVLKQLHNLGDSSIQNIKENKCYLNAERIFVSQYGIYLNTEFYGPLLVSNLIQDSEGMYTLGAYYYYICDDCGTSYNSYPSTCSVCGGTSFTLLDLTED